MSGLGGDFEQRLCSCGRLGPFLSLGMTFLGNRKSKEDGHSLLNRSSTGSQEARESSQWPLRQDR